VDSWPDIEAKTEEADDWTSTDGGTHDDDEDDEIKCAYV